MTARIENPKLNIMKVTHISSHELLAFLCAAVSDIYIQFFFTKCSIYTSKLCCVLYKFSQKKVILHHHTIHKKDLYTWADEENIMWGKKIYPIEWGSKWFFSFEYDEIYFGGDGSMLNSKKYLSLRYRKSSKNSTQRKIF